MKLNYIYFLFSVLLLLASCGSGNEESVKVNPPHLVSANPADGQTGVSEFTIRITLTFNENVTLHTPHNITLNGTGVSGVHPGIQHELVIDLPALLAGTTYTLVIPSNVVKGPTGAAIANEIRITFTTRTPPKRQFSEQAQKMMNYFADIYGKKTLSGTMANVSWNTEEADWVHTQTGKYPALNGFDFIHHIYSPADWIDYGNTEVVENWWNNNGIVAISWHWCVPKDMVSNTDNFAFYTSETTFDVSKISDINSAEYKLMLKDIDIISGYLKALKSKNIPVLWRPLHEASGTWFWWGAKGAEPCKALWKLMFERMTVHHGLDNLIWVWTSEGNDADWYPGDEYADIIGMDIYRQDDVHASQIARFNQLKTNVSNKKMIALSECGGIPQPAQMFEKGDTWLWFMPWYGEHTRDDKWNGAAYWKAVMNDARVITRDQMPSLK